MSNLSRLQDDLDEQALALDVARNQVGMKLPIDELLQKLHIPKDRFLQLANSELFKRQVKTFVKELEDNGVSFQLKARIQAEEMLKKNWQIVHDPDTPPTVAVKAIENTVRWAGLENKGTAVDATAGNSGFSITINIPAAGQVSPAATIIEHAPQAQEDEDDITEEDMLFIEGEVDDD